MNRVAEINVPKGCTKVYVDIGSDGRIVVSYDSEVNIQEFFCKETGRVEEVPKIGDFSVLWLTDNPAGAVVCNLKKIETEYQECYTGSDGGEYENAIKFRDYEQYLKVKGCYGEDEP